MERAMRLGCRAAIAVVLTAGSLALAGCQNFFVCDKASCTDTTTTTTTTGSATTDFAFVAYSASATSATITGYNLGSGALTSTSSLTVGYAPIGMAVTPNDEFLYVAAEPTSATPGIYGYSISSTGVLTALNSGNPIITEPVAGLAISPDGGWLYALDASIVAGYLTTEVNQYQVTTASPYLTVDSAGGLGVSADCYNLINTPATPICGISVSPNGAYVATALGANGEIVYPFSSSTGLGSSPVGIASPSTLLNDYAVTWDDSNYLYVGRTTQLASYPITTSNSVPAVGSANLLTVSPGPRAVALNSTYAYLYTANPVSGGTSTIDGYAIGTSGSFGALSTSPFSAPTDVAAIAFDKSGSYAVAAGYDASAGLQLYSVSSAGVLSKIASAGTTATTSYPVVLALTH